ncbi:MAG: hypothetical protein QM445_00935 [Thermotogota bacterium]|nr:hypothetical protein [Thermotogota bacterium]
MILWSCSVAGEESGRFLLKELKSIFTEGKHFEEENGKGVAVLFMIVLNDGVPRVSLTDEPSEEKEGT